MTALLGIGVIALAVGFWLLVGFALQWLWTRASDALRGTCYTERGGGESDD